MSPPPEQPARPFPTARLPDGSIIEAVAGYTGIAPMVLRGRSRERDVTYARHLAMYLLKEAGYTIAEIGRLLGNRDHSTVLAGIKRIRLEIGTRAETATDVEAIRERLRPD